MTKITKRTVDAAKPNASGERYYLWDSRLPGFGLLVLGSGIKTYCYQYRNAERQQRRITIGKHGSWTPGQARRKAEQFRRAVYEGRDPLREKRALESAPTVASLLDAYLQSERFNSKAEKTKAVDIGRIERHLKPLLGRRHVHSLTPGDVERAFAAIRDGKTAVDEKTGKRGRARVRGGEGTARMAIRLLRSAVSWAIAEGMVSSNPCTNVKLGSDGERDTILEDAAAYGRLFATLKTMEDQKRLRPQVADAVRLIAMTGARRGEVAGLRWSHVDVKRGLIVLPPRSHKTGRRTGKPRVIGLPDAGLAIIAKQGPGRPDDFVFKPYRGEGPLELSKPWREIRRDANLPDDIGLHGLRHSIATHLAMAGAGAPQLAALLGHSQISTAERYVHWAMDARRALAQRAAAIVLSGVDVLPKVSVTQAREEPGNVPGT